MNVQQLKYIVALNRSEEHTSGTQPLSQFCESGRGLPGFAAHAQCYACETGGRTGYPYLRTKQ